MEKSKFRSISQPNRQIYQDSACCYEITIALDDKNSQNDIYKARTYFNLANLKKEMSLREESENLYRKAIELDPTRYKYYFNLANMLRYTSSHFFCIA